MQDPSDPTWLVVVQGRKFSMTDYTDGASFDVTDMPLVNQEMPIISAIDQHDVVHASLNDHNEGLWESIETYLLMFFLVMYNTYCIIVMHVCF